LQRNKSDNYRISRRLYIVAQTFFSRAKLESYWRGSIEHRSRNFLAQYFYPSVIIFIYWDNFRPFLNEVSKWLKGSKASKISWMAKFCHAWTALDYPKEQLRLNNNKDLDFKPVLGSISPTFSRAFFARVSLMNVFFLVTFWEKRARKTLVKSTPCLLLFIWINLGISQLRVSKKKLQLFSQPFFRLSRNLSILKKKLFW